MCKLATEEKEIKLTGPESAQEPGVAEDLAFYIFVV